MEGVSIVLAIVGYGYSHLCGGWRLEESCIYDPNMITVIHIVQRQC